MFEVNDLILYGTTGVCRVESVGSPDMPGVDKERIYYRLQPVYQNGVIYAPADSDKVAMRRVITHEQADRLIDLIPTMDMQAIESRTPQELTEKYQTILKLHDCESLIELVMSLYAKKQTAELNKRKFGRVDEVFMKRARDLLHEELSVAIGIPLDEVEGYIAARVAELTPEPAEI